MRNGKRERERGRGRWKEGKRRKGVEGDGRGEEKEVRGERNWRKRGRRRGPNSCRVGFWLFRILDSVVILPAVGTQFLKTIWHFVLPPIQSSLKFPALMFPTSSLLPPNPSYHVSHLGPRDGPARGTPTSTGFLSLFYTWSLKRALQKAIWSHPSPSPLAFSLCSGIKILNRLLVSMRGSLSSILTSLGTWDPSPCSSTGDPSNEPAFYCHRVLACAVFLYQECPSRLGAGLHSPFSLLHLVSSCHSSELHSAAKSPGTTPYKSVLFLCHTLPYCLQYTSIYERYSIRVRLPYCTVQVICAR